MHQEGSAGGHHGHSHALPPGMLKDHHKGEKELDDNESTRSSDHEKNGM